MRRLTMLCALAVACGSTPTTVADAGSNDGIADCDDIIAACHHVDTGSGDIHQCHENAEQTWHGADCTSNKPRCVTLCTNAAALDSGM